MFVRANLNKPHTSESSGTNATFTKIYKETQIHWAFAHVYAYKRINNLIAYTNVFGLSGHHTKNYNISLLQFYIRLVCTSITQRITKVVYWNSI